MKLHFKEEPKAKGKVELTIAVSDCSPLMGVFRLKVTSQSALKIEVVPKEWTGVHIPYRYAEERAPVAFTIYQGTHEIDEAHNIINWLTDNLYSALENGRSLKYLSEVTIKKPTKVTTKKEA
jgi:hypothetical protein